MIGTPKNYAQNTLLQRQGDPVRHISIILSGSARAVTYTKAGQKVWVTDYEAGELFGLEILQANATSICDIVANGSVEIHHLTIEGFLSYVSSRPEVTQAVLGHLGRQLESRARGLIEALSVSARGRVCAELVRLAKPMGKAAPAFFIRPTPVFSELALRVGSTRESVSRTVSGLAQSGVIVRKTGAIVVPDIDRLRSRIT
ncbi:MAG: Crp/Fnr family transcriptional regulator [Litorimonas sp.]